ncbi:unnamed protein product [Urochloa humidicola]
MQERRRGSSSSTKTMAPRCLAVVLLLAAAAAAPCSAAQQIEEACRKASMAHAGVSYEHCVWSLGRHQQQQQQQGDNRNTKTTMLGLAVAAARMAAEQASATEARMEALGEVEESPHARARLHHCLDLYNAAADVLRDALDNLRARVYGKAMHQIAAAMGASHSCEDVWKGEDRVPVADHDREYGRMALLALGLATGAIN